MYIAYFLSKLQFYCILIRIFNNALQVDNVAHSCSSFFLSLSMLMHTRTFVFLFPHIYSALGSYKRVHHISMYVMKPFAWEKQNILLHHRRLFRNNERTRSVQLILDIFLNYSPELHFKILLGCTIYYCTVALQQLYYYLYSGRALHNNWGGKKDPRARYQQQRRTIGLWNFAGMCKLFQKITVLYFWHFSLITNTASTIPEQEERKDGRNKTQKKWRHYSRGKIT